MLIDLYVVWVCEYGVVICVLMLDDCFGGFDVFVNGISVSFVGLGVFVGVGVLVLVVLVLDMMYGLVVVFFLVWVCEYGVMVCDGLGMLVE